MDGWIFGVSIAALASTLWGVGILLERNDVTWAIRAEYEEPWALINEGTNTAWFVRATLKVDDEHRQLRRRRVAGGEKILLDVPPRQAEPRRGTWNTIGDFEQPVLRTWRVTWKTRLARAHVEEGSLGRRG